MMFCIMLVTKHNRFQHENDKNVSEHQIIILEWFLKEHLTLKTGVMAAEN